MKDLLLFLTRNDLYLHYLDNILSFLPVDVRVTPRVFPLGTPEDQILAEIQKKLNEISRPTIYLGKWHHPQVDTGNVFSRGGRTVKSLQEAFLDEAYRQSLEEGFYEVFYKLLTGLADRPEKIIIIEKYLGDETITEFTELADVLDIYTPPKSFSEYLKMLALNANPEAEVLLVEDKDAAQEASKFPKKTLIIAEDAEVIGNGLPFPDHVQLLFLPIIASLSRLHETGRSIYFFESQKLYEDIFAEVIWEC